MKTTLRYLFTSALVIFGLFVVPLAPAAPFEWDGDSGIDLNWSTPANWTPSGSPGAADAAFFSALGVGVDSVTVNNTVGTSTAVTSLSYTNSAAGSWHVTEIPVGNTLTVSGTLTAGGLTGNGVPLLVSLASMVGGGRLVVNGTPFTIGNGGSAGGLNGGSTLDLTGLSEFIYTSPAGTMNIGAVNRSTAILNLASSSNSITVGTINLNTGSSSSSGTTVAMRLGAGTNNINANTINIGANRTGATMQFGDATGGLRLRGAGGTDADRTAMTLGNRNAGSSSPSTTTGTLNLNGHRADLKISTMTLGAQNRAGGEAGLVGSGVLQFDDGIVDITTLNMAVCNGNSPTAGARGTLTIGANGTLTVGSISMANVTSTGVGANASSTMTISGGLVNCAGNLVKTTGGLTTNTITVETGGRLYMGSSGRIGTTAIPTDNLNLTDATLRLSPAVGATNVVVTTLTTAGAGNTIELGLLPSITSYPVTFRLIKYDGAIAGNGYNFTLSGLPGAYTGSLVDNAAQSAVDLVLTAGPVAQNITWNGNLSDDWNFITKNWRFGLISTNYFDGDFVTFNDAASGTTTVDLTTDFLPGSVTVSNSALSYTFTGSGKIGGSTGLTKQGSGSLLVNNSGVNDFGGSIAISGGTVQVGNGGTSGNLGSGAISMDAGLTFNRSDDTTVANLISGAASGSLTKNGAGALTLSAANTFTGAVAVVQGTLKTGNGSALGRTNGITTISSGATLDVNAQNLGAEPVTVSGTGVGGNGAIINSGAGQNNALRYVTLAGNTTFGGLNRWDIRGAPSTADPANAGLSTGGNPYNLLKIGTNTVGLVGVTVDPALGDVDVQQGTLAFETASTGLGNPANTLTVRAGASLQLFNTTNQLNKVITLHGTGTNNTVVAGDGIVSLNNIIGPMTLNGECWMSVNTSDFMTFSNAITGSGSLVKQGAGTLILSGPTKAYSGNTTVSNGILVLNTTLSGGGTLTTTTNTILGGTGTNIGPVVVSGPLAPGASAGTFGSGALTLNAGATLEFELNSVTTIGGGVNDLINVTGNLTANNNSINLTLLAGSLQAGTYRLINYTGTLIGTFNPVVTIAGGASHYGLALSTATPGEVNLIVTGSAGRLAWTGLNGTAWDIGLTANWSNAVTTLADVFFQGDSVLLDDTSVSGFILDIAASTAVSPSVITNDSLNGYIINGPGKISGGTSIVKRGDSTLTIASSNDFTGTVTVQQGTLLVGNGGALGSVTGGTVVSSGATLDFNAFNIGQEPVTVSGTGVGGGGALYNSGAQVFPAIARVTLAGDTTFGGVGRWDLRSSATGDSSLSSLLTGGQPYKITKIGGNQVSIVGTTVDAALGDIDVQQGVLSFEVATTSAGNPLSNLTVQAGATLQFFNLSNPFNKRIALSDASINNDSGATVIIGPVLLQGSSTIDVDPGTSVTISNTVSGGGSLTKIETGVLNLTSATYTGDTTINAGTLALLGSSSLASSPNILLAAASTVLDASARTDGTLTIGSARTLAGLGTVRGSLTVNAGGTVSPGNDLLGLPVGNLTVTNVVTLGGTNVMQTDKNSLTNDLIQGATSIAFGGRLVVSDVFAIPYADGDVFKLFDAGSYSGSFTIEPATPGAGLFWDTSELNTSGILKVVSTAPAPAIASATRVGNNLVLAGSGGAPGGGYSVVSSTDVTLPVGSWTLVGTANFDGSGNFSFPTPINFSTPQRFFRIRVP